MFSDEEEEEMKKEIDPLNRLPRDAVSKIVEFLDPASKLNLMLCSRRTYNKIVGKCEYFRKIIFELHQGQDEWDKSYTIEMFYEHDEKNGVPDNSIRIDEAFLYLTDSDITVDDEEEDSDYRKRKTFCTRVFKRGKDYPGGFDSDINEQGSATEVAYRYFEELLTKNQKGLTFLEIGENVLGGMPMFCLNYEQIDSFPRLENLVLRSEDSFRKFLRKLPIGCKNVKLVASESDLYSNSGIKGCSDSKFITSLPQIKATTESLSLKDTNVGYNDLIELKADKAKMLLRTMTDEGLNAFVKLWKNGHLPNNIISRKFILARKRKVSIVKVLEDIKVLKWNGTNFDVPEVYRYDESTSKVFRTKSTVYQNRFMDIIFCKTDVTMIIR